MKLKSISCPTCGAGINIDIKGRNTIFCPYCGGQILIDDDITITHNININSRQINDAAIEKERRIDRQNEREHEETKLALRMMPFLLLASFVLVGILMAWNYSINISEKKAISEGKIQVGISSYDIKEDKTKYQGIVSQFEAAGFSNITTIDLDDAGIFTNREDTIESVSIDGDTSFSSEDYYAPDAKIIISYH